MLTFYRITKFIVRHLLPRSARYPLAYVVGTWVCILNHARRDVILFNLTPLLGPTKAKKTAPRLMANFLMTAVDFFCAPADLTARTEIDNWDRLASAHRAGKRIIAVTAHLGHWELGISCLMDRGMPVAGVYAPYRDDHIVQWIMSHRDPRVEWIPTEPGASVACIAALQKGKILGMVADIPFGEKGRRVKIAGHTARLPIGPWAIAAMAGAIVFPAFIVREGESRYRTVIHDAIEPQGSSLRRRIENAQDIFVRHLESYLQRYPHQWGVLAPFWEPAK